MSKVAVAERPTVLELLKQEPVQAAELAPAGRALTLGDMVPRLNAVRHPRGKYVRVDQEPDIEVAVRSRRHDIEKSRWELGYRLEGERNAPLSKVQAQWTAAMLRWAADLIEGPVSEEDGPQAQIEGYAERLSARMLTDMKELSLLAEWLVERTGWDHAAKVMGMKVHQVRALRKEFKPLLKEHPSHNRHRLERTRRDVLPSSDRTESGQIQAGGLPDPTAPLGPNPTLGQTVG